MADGFIVIFVHGRRSHNYGVKQTRSMAEDLAKCLYMQFPRRWDCYVKIVDRKTGYTTIL